MWRRGAKGGITGLLLAALTACGVVAIAATTASAQQSRAETERQLRVALVRLCQEGYTGERADTCAVNFEENAVILRRELAIERQVRSRVDRVSLRITERFAFSNGSYFFCAGENTDRRSPLFMSCDFDSGALGPKCITGERIAAPARGPAEVERYALPIGRVATPTTVDCAELSAALNSLVGPPGANSDPIVRDPD